jgi:hypothetical protein
LCQVNWFGQSQIVEVFGSAGANALVGLRLLEDLVLTIDYPARTVFLAVSPSAQAGS